VSRAEQLLAAESDPGVRAAVQRRVSGVWATERTISDD
jgi:hypothetical protein